METRNNISKHTEGLVPMHHHIDMMPKVRKADDRAIKLEYAEVSEVIKHLELGGSIDEIANMYSVSSKVISAIHVGSGRYEYLRATARHLDMQKLRKAALNSVPVKEEIEDSILMVEENISNKPGRPRSIINRDIDMIFDIMNKLIEGNSNSAVAAMYDISESTIISIYLGTNSYEFLHLNKVWCEYRDIFAESKLKSRRVSDEVIYGVIDLTAKRVAGDKVRAKFSISKYTIANIKFARGIYSYLKDDKLWKEMNKSKIKRKTIHASEDIVYEAIKLLNSNMKPSEICAKLYISQTKLWMISNAEITYSYLKSDKLWLDYRSNVDGGIVANIGYSVKENKAKVISKVISDLSEFIPISIIAETSKLSRSTINRIKTASHAYQYLKEDENWINMHKICTTKRPDGSIVVSKIKPIDIYGIIELLGTNMEAKDVAKVHNIARTTIYLILSANKHYSHLSIDPKWIKMRQDRNNISIGVIDSNNNSGEPNHTSNDFVIEETTQTFTVDKTIISALLGSLKSVSIFVNRAEKYIIDNPITFNIDNVVARTVYASIMLQQITDMSIDEIAQHIEG